MSKLRVTCVAFCRVEYQGRYLFLLNLARARSGNYTAIPLGGALAYDDAAILRRLDAELEKPGTNDLRFYIDKGSDDARASLAMLRRWFKRRTGRELDPFREMREELVDEQKILPWLTRQDVEITYAGMIEERQTSNRPGARVAETHYFREVFDVKLRDSHLMFTLLASDRQRGAFWLTLDEAERGEPVRWDGHEVKIDLAHVLRVGNGHGASYRPAVLHGHPAYR
ncbi:MAG: hypothetical protein JXB47_08180 [Anaerolineae bacterium]|nr:hypothetical protein [Anaerolineae bacterium]